jgi:hypothetical protein
VELCSSQCPSGLAHSRFFWTRLGLFSGVGLFTPRPQASTPAPGTQPAVQPSGVPWHLCRWNPITAQLWEPLPQEVFTIRRWCYPTVSVVRPTLLPSPIPLSPSRLKSTSQCRVMGMRGRTSPSTWSQVAIHIPGGTCVYNLLTLRRLECQLSLK